MYIGEIYAVLVGFWSHFGRILEEFGRILETFGLNLGGNVLATVGREVRHGRCVLTLKTMKFVLKMMNLGA